MTEERWKCKECDCEVFYIKWKFKKLGVFCCACNNWAGMLSEWLI